MGLAGRLLLICGVAAALCWWRGAAFANGLSDLLLAFFALFIGQRLLRADRKQKDASVASSPNVKKTLLQDAQNLLALSNYQSPLLLYGAWFGGALKVAAVLGSTDIGSFLRMWATGTA